MVKKYVLYVDMYEDHAEIDEKDQLTSSEIIAIMEDLWSDLKESWLNV